MGASMVAYSCYCLPFYVQLFASVQYKVCVTRLEDFPTLCKGSVQNWPLPVTKLEDAAETQYKQFNYHRACLPSLLLAKFMCFLLLFFIEERQQNAVTFFLRTTPATIVCLFSVHQASLASLHCLLLKKMHRFQEDFRSGKNDYQVYFLLPSTKCDFFVRKYS